MMKLRARYLLSMAQSKRPKGRGWKQGIDPRFIGRRIEERRELARLTQQELARAIGRAQSNVSAYETGESVPNLAALRDLAVALKTTVDFLIGVDTVAGGYPRSMTPEPSSSIRPGRASTK